MKSRILLIIIVFLATFLRLYKLGEIPPSIISDEASIGYNAYSILKTGRDEWGNFLPLSFPAFGDYKLPGLIYATVPSVAIFGLSEFSTRLPSAIFGILTVILVYFLSMELFNNKKTSLLTSFFTAISPWSLHLSRMAIEANMAVFFTALGILFFLKSFRRKNLLYFSFLSFSATFYIYNSNRVFVPLLLISLIIISRKSFGNFKKNILPPLIIFLLVTLPVSKYFIEQSITGRFSKVSVFSETSFSYQAKEERGFCWNTMPKFLCKLAFNKPIKIIDSILKNYVSHYSIRFLFLTGPENLKHYSLPNFGEYYIFQIPFFFIGLFLLFMNKSPAKKILIPWLIFFPVASSLTATAHPVRAVVGIPVFELIISYGFVSFFESIKSKMIKYAVLLGTIAFALLNLNEYFFLYYKKYSKENSQAFQYGYKEVFRFLKNEGEKNNKKIVITKKLGEPQIFYLFYNKIDPYWYQTSSEVERTEREDKWKSVNKIGKYYFIDFSKEKPKREDGTLYILNPHEVVEPLTPENTFFYLNGEVSLHSAK